MKPDPLIPAAGRRLRFGILCFLPAFWFCACQISVKPRDPDLHGDHPEGDVKASSEQIRMQMRAQVDPMCGEVESAADRILAETADPEIRRAAIEWKAQAVPALRKALFQPDPGMAVFDTWVLTNQMTIYFSQGDGARSLGKFAPAAVATCLSLERRMNEVAASMTKSGDVSKIRGLARNWAAAHPIQDSISHRESTLSRAAKFDLGPDLTATEAIGDITVSVDDLGRRLETYSDQLFRQARWEAELAVGDLTRDLQLEQAAPLAEDAVTSVARLSDSVGTISSSVETLMPAVERLAVVAESLADVVASERTEVLKSVADEMARTIGAVQGEREIILQQVTAERIAALQTMHEVVTAERKEFTEDAGNLTIEAIDHAFSRIFLLAGVVLAALAVFGIVALLALRHYGMKLVRELAGARPAGAT